MGEGVGRGWSRGWVSVAYVETNRCTQNLNYKDGFLII